MQLVLDGGGASIFTQMQAASYLAVVHNGLS